MEKIDEKYFDKNNNNSQNNFEVKDFLEKNEKVLWRGKPKKSSYGVSKSLKFMPIGLIWGIIDFSALFYLFTTVSSLNFAIKIAIIAFFALHLLPFWIWLSSLIKGIKESNSTYYLITNKRILKYIEPFSGSFDSINLKNVNSVKLNRGFIDTMLRVGDLYISDGTTTIVFFDIYNSNFMHDKMLNLIKTTKIKNDEFSKESIICDHCGSYINNKFIKCPNCGAGLKDKNS